MEKNTNTKFVGNAKVAKAVIIAAIAAVIVDGITIPAANGIQKDDEVAIYHVSDAFAKTFVAVPTKFDSETKFVSRITEEAAKKAFTKLACTRKSFIAEAVKAAEAAEAKEESLVEEEKKAAKEAEIAKAKAAKEEAEAQAKHEAAAKAWRAKVKAEGEEAKTFLEQRLTTIEIGKIIYKADGKITGKVEELDKNLFGYYIKKAKEKIFISMYETCTEEAMVEATFNGTEPEKVISRNLFNKKMDAIKAAGLDYKTQEAANYKPEFRFVQDNLNGADKDENGNFVHFANKEIKK